MAMRTRSVLVMVIAAGAAVNAAAMATGPGGEPGDLAGVMATFDPNGEFDNAGLDKTDRAAARPTLEQEMASEVDEAWLASKRAAMDAQLAEVFLKAPPKSKASLPNYRYLRGVAVPMHLDTMKLVVKAGGEGNARLAAGKAGLMLAADGHRTVNGYTVLALAKPVSGLQEADDVIQRILNAAGVEFAGPVFMNPFIESGTYFPTTHSLVQVVDGLDALAVAKFEAREFSITNPLLGGMPGAMELTCSERNGFRVMTATNRLAESPNFKWASPAAIESLRKEAYVPTDPNWGSSWAHRNTGAMYNGLTGVVDWDMDTDQAWDIQRGSADVLTLVMDDGRQTNHPDINWADGRNFTTGETNGVGTGATGSICENHGTAVSGCVAGRIDNGLGTVGTAPGSRILFAKICVIDNEGCANQFDDYSASWVVNALNWGRNQGARVSNASFQVGQDDAIQATYNSTWTSGMVHFASAGNGGNDSIGDPVVTFPALAANVFGVGSLRADGAQSTFSNYGSGLDFCAPGSGIYTTDRLGALGYDPSDYTWTSGTSFASPLAAGVAALFFSQHPFATAAECRTSIRATCVDLGDPGVDSFFAYGFVNAFAALKHYSPANDECLSATVIPTNAYNPAVVDVKWATGSLLEVQESCVNAVNNTVFYRFTAPNTGVVSINTNGSTYDTVLSVFDGCVFFFNGGRLDPTELACDNDGGTGSQSQITNLPVTSGQTILIKVSSVGEASGASNLDFNFAFTPVAPPNDSCGLATTIPWANDGIYWFNPPLLDTDYATVATCEPLEACGAATNSNSVFYRFTPEESGMVSIDTFGSNFDTVLSVFNGCTFSLGGGCLQPTRLACNDDTPGSQQSSLVNVPVIAGQTYVIKVADYGAEGGGLLDFNFTFLPQIPSNDECENATVIPPVSGMYDPSTFHAYSASTSACENAHSCLADTSHSVWYKFVAPSNGTIMATTQYSYYDTILSFYPGCSTFRNGGVCSPVPDLACSDDAEQFYTHSKIRDFRVDQGSTTLIKVSLKGQVFDTFANRSILNFNFEFTPDCPADWDTDGDVDSDDIVGFFSAWDGGEADVDGDGDTDSDDVIFFFTQWDSGC